MSWYKNRGCQGCCSYAPHYETTRRLGYGFIKVIVCARCGHEEVSNV